MAKLGHISGTSYRTKTPLDGPHFEAANRDLVIGKRDAAGGGGPSILLGKVAERSSASDYFDANTWLDVTFPHVVFVCGRRGSGKSYDLGIMAEGLSAQGGSNFSTVGGQFSTIIFDLQNQFWTLGTKIDEGNAADLAQSSLVKQWRLEGETRSAQLFLPRNCPAVLGSELQFIVPPNCLELTDWLALIGADRFDPMGQLLRHCLALAQLNNPSFAISDLIQLLRTRAAHTDLARFQQPTSDGLEWRLSALDDIGFFMPGSSIVDQLLTPGVASVVMLRALDDSIKSVVVATTMRQIERTMSQYHQKLKVAMRQGIGLTDGVLPSRVWILIDEAHLVCPSDRATPANATVIDYVKRGRDAGLSLVLATQQPSALDSGAISQVDLSLIHRLTFEADITAALQRIPSAPPRDLTFSGRDVSDPVALIRGLAPGECLASDAEASRAFIMRSRPRISPHGGGEPQL